MTDSTPPSSEQWRTYDEFAAGIDTYRLPSTTLNGITLSFTLEDQARLRLDFSQDQVEWVFEEPNTPPRSACDPYDAVAVRDDVVFVHLALTSRDGEALTLVYSSTNNHVIVVQSIIHDKEIEGEPRVHQNFWAGSLDGKKPIGSTPGPSRDLIGTRNLYRYSPEHLYEHVYLSSTRYTWQCIEGVQRGHGDTDLSTVWKLDDGLYLFCFREFRIAVASVWLHDLGDRLRTTGIFLGLTSSGLSEHSRAGGHIRPLGSVTYPGTQPV